MDGSTASARTTQPWWLESAPTANPGLSQAQAQEVPARLGSNSFEARKKQWMALQLLARFRNPLVLVLLTASAISAATGDVANFLIIMLMVLLSVTLDFLQEHRAGRAAEKLRRGSPCPCPCPCAALAKYQYSHARVCLKS